MSHHQEQPPSICILEGSLAKMKRQPKLLTSRWNKRWIMLTNDALEWRHSTHGDARGRIKLDDVEKIYKLKSLSNKTKHDSTNSNAAKKRRGSSFNNAKILIIKTKERNLCLSAQSGEDCDRWYRAIQMQLDLREGGTVSGPRGTRNRRQSNGGGDKYKVRDGESVNLVVAYGLIFTLLPVFRTEEMFHPFSLRCSVSLAEDGRCCEKSRV